MLFFVCVLRLRGAWPRCAALRREARALLTVVVRLRALVFSQCAAVGAVAPPLAAASPTGSVICVRAHA